MNERAERLALKRRLPRTWDVFFARHGDFTAAQAAAIPAVLDGENVVLCAPTASGKTEAVLAPLIERHCPVEPFSGPALSILYITPTRALASDLFARLQPAVERLRLRLAVKTRDLDTFSLTHPAHILITTPESTDSMLSNHARVFATLRAAVLDELHVFDGTPRGDHLRIVLRRLNAIRAFAAQRNDAPAGAIQFVALSASLAVPDVVAARYFASPSVIEIPGHRSVDAEYVPFGPDSLAALSDYLSTFRARGWCKALVFCNTRAEVEMYAALARQRSPFGGAVYTHYSNLASLRRQEIESAFNASAAALCFATSTLELGIDIGDIDVVLLIGAPGSVGSFLQRIGRGNRRKRVTHVACFWRTPVERLAFEALVANVDRLPASAGHFRLGVAVQQIFSLLKQSPTGALRLSLLTALFDGLLTTPQIEAMLGALTQSEYLQPGRPGEWRAARRLNRLVDQQASARPVLSLYSNIRSTDRVVEVRDQHSQRTLARVDSQSLDQPSFTLEGREMRVTWYEGDVVWVVPAAQTGPGAPQFRSARQMMSHDLADLIATQIGIPPGQSPFLTVDDGFIWYHMLGDLYGEVLAALLRPHTFVQHTAWPGLTLWTASAPDRLPALGEDAIQQHVARSYRALENLLPLGPFHTLLPVALRREAVEAHFDVPRFLGALSSRRPVVASVDKMPGLSEIAVWE
ncbi:MAG: DEAD/DEAH box helicase [Anaerolineae bacterium]|nr:DEAD/DEAH box helicase [Anaerolineae bacterium]